MLLKLLINVISQIRTKYNQTIIKMKVYYYRKKGIKIGCNFTISRKTYIDLHKPEYIEIGDNVKLTRGAMILCYDSSKDMDEFKKYFDNPFKRVKIGNGIYVGAHSIIMPGVVIGDNVIIGANSVVTHDIPSNCIVAGVPARKIRELIGDNKTIK